MSMNQPRLRALGLIALVAGSALAASMGQLFGVTLTGDRLLGCAALLVATILLLGGRTRWTALHGALAVFVAVQVVTSLARAASWPHGLKFVSVYALGFGCFVVTAELARGPIGRHAAERAWRLTGAVAGGLGAILALAACASQTELWGTGPSQMVPIGRTSRVLYAAKTTFPEWNLLSSFLLVGFTFALWRWSRQAGVPVALIGIVAGLVLGVTRAAWIAMAAIAVVWFVTERPGLRRAAGLALMVALPFTAQGLSLGASPIVARVIKPIVTRSDWNLTTRGLVNQAVAQSFQQAPLIGQGAGSSNQLTVRLPDGRVEGRLWTGNMELFILHDSGVVGLAALLAVIAAAVWTAARAARRHAPGWRELGMPLAVSGLALLWAWQFTHALWLMYPYVFLGVLVACAEPGAEG